MADQAPTRRGRAAAAAPIALVVLGALGLLAAFGTGDPAPALTMVASGALGAGLAWLIGSRTAGGLAPHDDAAPRTWLAEVASELERSRRYEREFGILRFELAEHAGQQTDSRARAGHPAVPHLRSTDGAWIHGNRLFVLARESDHSGCMELVDRILRDVPEGAISVAACATFPRDGVTIGALLRALSAAHRSDVPTVRP